MPKMVEWNVQLGGASPLKAVLFFRHSDNKVEVVATVAVENKKSDWPVKVGHFINLSLKESRGGLS